MTAADRRLEARALDLLALAGETNLDRVLHRVVSTARVLVDARYGGSEYRMAAVASPGSSQRASQNAGRAVLIPVLPYRARRTPGQGEPPASRGIERPRAEGIPPSSTPPR